jgi:hypothetical protein
VLPIILFWSRIKQEMGVDVLRRGFGLSYAAIDSGQLRAHAIENAPISQSAARYPVLIFSHGLAVPTFNYTGQFEAIASHGYSDRPYLRF